GGVGRSRAGGGLRVDVEPVEALAEDAERGEVVAQHVPGDRRQAVEDLANVEHTEKRRQQPFDSCEAAQQADLVGGRRRRIVRGASGERSIAEIRAGSGGSLSASATISSISSS